MATDSGHDPTTSSSQPNGRLSAQTPSRVPPTGPSRIPFQAGQQSGSPSQGQFGSADPSLVRLLRDDQASPNRVRQEQEDEHRDPDWRDVSPCNQLCSVSGVQTKSAMAAGCSSTHTVIQLIPAYVHGLIPGFQGNNRCSCSLLSSRAASCSSFQITNFSPASAAGHSMSSAILSTAAALCAPWSISGTSVLPTHAGRLSSIHSPGQVAEVAKVPGKTKKVWALPSQIQANSFNAPFRAKHSFNVTSSTLYEQDGRPSYPCQSFSTSIDIGHALSLDASGNKVVLKQASGFRDDSMESMSSQEWQIIAANMPQLIEEEWIPEGYFVTGSDLATEVTGMFANLFHLVTARPDYLIWQQILKQEAIHCYSRGKEDNGGGSCSPGIGIGDPTNFNTSNRRIPTHVVGMVRGRIPFGHAMATPQPLVPFAALKRPLETPMFAPSVVENTDLETTRKKQRTSSRREVESGLTAMAITSALGTTASWAAPERTIATPTPVEDMDAPEAQGVVTAP
ncbi:hypothetical protein BT96DRAFT_938492 [Gymnopus androsaceus JB14]|uniref:Uncharacterized protein n=1 Tax=Gymnopus androsaceus JB14 TaxID=1447944 RepID=A0A6A4HVM8_9AGAR|nr:hypothetical protein BT96DRAFT_938492 [Gymnopus androsaceus JB14]